MTPSVRRNMVTEHCVQGTPPPCTCACPLNFNLREFMRLTGIVGVESGYRVMSEELCFPEIAHRLCGGRCMEHCVEDIDIYGLEEACLLYAQKKDPAKVSVVPKKETVAVIGAGVSGMVCALRLAVRGFPVTVYDSAEEPGGTLCAHMERELYLREFERQFMHAPYTFVPGHTITDPSELSSFDAVYVATGARGAHFGLLEGLDPNAFATTKRGWFLGGELTGADPFTAMAQGRVAATSVEKYLLMSGSMRGDDNSFLRTECQYEVKRLHPPLPKHTGGWKKSEVRAEAKRCRQCDCTICYDACAFMQCMKMLPKELEDNVLGAMSPDGLEEPQGYRMIYSCQVCGHCGSVCPRGIDMEPLFMRAKIWLKDRGKNPDQLHGYYLEDLEDATGKNRLLQKPEGCETLQYLFFPGCQATASGGNHVSAFYGHLLRTVPESGILAGCCGVPAFWAGKTALFEDIRESIRKDWEEAGRPVFLLMCPTCRKSFAEYLPEITCMSVYEFLAKHPVSLPVRGRDVPVRRAVFDACASRGFPKMQKAVREILRHCFPPEVIVEELPDNLATARCCGSGGHAYPSNPEVALLSTEMASALSDAPYVVYCENCRNAFLSRGKACTHVLDEVFGLAPRGAAPHAGEYKKERRELICSLQGIPFEEEAHLNLKLSDAMQKKLDRALISLEEIEETIRYCEENERHLLTEHGTLLGSLRIGYVTVWAEYSREGDTYTLVNAYSHRIEIRGIV